MAYRSVECIAMLRLQVAQVKVHEWDRTIAHVSKPAFELRVGTLDGRCDESISSGGNDCGPPPTAAVLESQMDHAVPRSNRLLEKCTMHSFSPPWNSRSTGRVICG